MSKYREYRCTREYPYTAPGCPGNTDPSARQGHYIVAATEAGAIAQMALRYPQDVAEGYGFTAKPWKEFPEGYDIRPERVPLPLQPTTASMLLVLKDYDLSDYEARKVWSDWLDLGAPDAPARQ